jgi:predicted outer membrane repeat protein
VIRAAAFCLALAALLSAAVPNAEAKRFFVPQDHKTLQKGIDAASDGDTIWVAAGTYAGPFTMKKRLVLFGDAGSDNTILDGGDSVRVLDIEGVKGAAIIGFTIRRGKANAGGGIHCVRDSSILFAGCKFEKNWESAISAWQSADLNMRELFFIENKGSAVSLNFSTVVMRMCSFTRNSGYAGGAISFVNSSPVLPIRQCAFEENRAEGATGGAVNADSSDVLIGDSQFKGNTAKVAGGAIASMNGSRLGLSRILFYQNNAAASGAVHVDKSSLNVGICVFDQNRAIALGSAIGIVGRGLANINPLIQGNTFYKNSSDNEGAVIWAEQVSPEIRKDIFVVDKGQKIAAGINSSPLYQCNLIHDPSGEAISTLPSADTLVGDPLFCGAESGDFYLKDLSPAVLATCGPIGALPKRCTSFKLAPSK